MITKPSGVERSVEAQLKPASQHILATARLLSELQSQPVRRGKEEIVLATLVNRIVNSYSIGEDEIGVASATGTGILTTEYAPRAWLDKRDGPWPWSRRSSREFALREGYSDEIKAFDGNKVAEGHFLLHGFMRGDRLGYRYELGNTWYFMFGWGEKYYVPVNGLSAVKLKVVYTGF